MRKMKAVLIVTVASALASGALAFARGGGGAGGGMGPGSHPSAAAVANSNAPFSADRDKGLQRAEDRMSQEGLQHEQATKHPRNKGKGSNKK